MMKIANEQIEDHSVAGSQLSRSVSSFSTVFSGWAGPLAKVFPYSNPNIADTTTALRSVPSVANGRAWVITHGINDYAFYGTSATTNNFVQTRLAWKHALRSVIARLRAGALYCSNLNSSGAITWDSIIAFGGSGSWSDQASVGANTGPAYKYNATNGGTVTITLPNNTFNIAVTYLSQLYAWGKCNTNLNNTDVTSTMAGQGTFFATDFPSSLNFVIGWYGSTEQALVTAGQGTSSWTITRGFNSTSKATHAVGDEVYMVAAGQANLTGTVANATGSLVFSAQSAGGANIGGTGIPVTKRIACTSADAGRTIILTTAGIIASDTYTRAQFDSVSIEATLPPPIVIPNTPRYGGFAGGYNVSGVGGYGTAYFNNTDWTNFTGDTTSVIAEFDGMVKLADFDTPVYNRGFFPGSSMNNSDVTTTINVTVNDVTTFTAMGAGWVASNLSEDVLVTTSTFVSGSTFTLVLTRGYNSTAKQTHATTDMFGDASWFHTDNIHLNALGHAVHAQTIFDTFATMTPATYQIALSNGNVTQDNQRTYMGIHDNWYIYENINVAINNAGAFAKNKLFYVPWYLPDKVILVGGVLYTGGTGGTATAVRMGLYDMDSTRSFPGALIKEFGTIATTAANTGIEVPSHIILDPGWVWLAYVNQGTTSGTFKTIAGLGYDPPMPYHMEGSILTGAATFTQNMFFVDTGSITGSLPTTAAPTGDPGPRPYCGLHLRTRQYG